MSESFDCTVVFSETDLIYNLDADGRDICRDEYDDMRGRPALVCSQFGSVKALLVYDSSEEEGTPYYPLYHIVDDHYSNDKFVYVGIEYESGFTTEWIQEVARMLASTDGWAVSVGFDDGFCIVYADRVVVGGDMFRSCSSLHEVVSSAHETDTWD